MSIKLKLQSRQVQSLVLTPQMRQAIHILQLNNLELNEFLTEQVNENPFLEIHDSQNFDSTLDASRAASGELTAIAPSGKSNLERVMITFNRPGNTPGSDSHVWRPIIIGKPIVIFLNRFRSVERRQGILPS